MLLAHLREKNIPLEICITSNVRTGAIATLEDHPVRRLFDAGVPIILNTDDPALFDCTLPGEYRLAQERFGLSDQELELIARNAFQFSFR
jgi:aminodeoxyfutalosine deaminase